MKKLVKILIAIVAVLLLVLVGLGFYAWQQTKKQKAAQEAKEAKEAKRQELLTMIDGKDNFNQWVRAEEKLLSGFGLTDDEKKQLEDLLKDGDDAKEEDYEKQMSVVRDLKDLEQKADTRQSDEARKKIDTLKQLVPGYASAEEKKQLEQYAAEAEKLITDKKYAELPALEDNWKKLANTASGAKTGYKVTITQHDFSEYPKTRLYLDIRDSASGELIKELSPDMFYVSEKAASGGDFLSRAVQKAVLMDQNERLNINMIADISDSMNDNNKISSAKQVMMNFLDTVQFSAGDQVKLTPFNSFIDKRGVFTGDINMLRQSINSLVADGQTKLYDSIIYGVQDVSGQEGAKCVIAFTDGMDVGSSNTAQDVINLVSRYKIPVFIVRIGDNSSAQEDSVLNQIASASGGSFANLGEFNVKMSDFYSKIYRQLKEYYVLEYTVDSAQDMLQQRDIKVYVQKNDKGGESTVSAVPGREVFDNLLGNYLRSYIVDMNNRQYSHLIPYVDDTAAPDDRWSIQWQMKKQVSGGFSNVREQSLMDYSITDEQLLDENTVQLKSSEDYDTVYEEPFGNLKTISSELSNEVLQYLQTRMGMSTVDDSLNLRVWAKVNQVPKYSIRRGADGKWKFSKYVDDLELGEKWSVYDVEIIGQP